MLIGRNRRGQNRTGLRAAAEGVGERLPLPVHPAQDLFDEMYASLADRSTRQLLNRLARLDVLLIDELGYLNLKPEQSNIFFKLMEERYRQHSTIITTNLVYDEWQNFLGNRADGGRAAEPCCGITATPCTSTARRCASCRAETHGRRPQPGRICPPGAGGVPQDAGHDGHRPPSGPGAGGPTLSTRRAAGA